MDGKQTFKLKVARDEDKAAIVKILVMNGYSVRLTVVKEGNRNVKVVEYWEDKK